jgi:HEAT repeat protein
MNSSEIEALFARALVGDFEAEDAWEAVGTLRLNGNREIFEHAAAWCLSDDPLKRARAASILCQLRRGTIPRHEFLFRDESYALLTDMLEKEQDPTVLYSIISGLGHLDNALAIPFILRYQDSPVHRVRYAVAFALGCFPNDERSIEGLLKLTSDPEDEIRDWAVFGLGVMGAADSPEIREALFRCLSDKDEDVRDESAVGLGKRRDQRLIPILLTMLEDPNIKVRVAEAAAALLGMDKDPPEWTAEDYRAAIAKIGE